MKMQLFLLLIISVFASEDSEPTENSAPFVTENTAQNAILVKIEEDEYIKHTSYYIGVHYHKLSDSWHAQRWSKHERKTVHNGSYKNEETSAHASDTLARKLVANGEKDHKLNFPRDDTEVYPERTNYFGVSYNQRYATWCACRYSKNEKKAAHNGNYKDEETAAHASDTLARKLIANGEKGHKLNFPDDDTEVHQKEKTSSHFGVSYITRGIWRAERWSKNEGKNFYNGTHKNEESAAHASDTLARKLIANGEKGHKLNFPDDESEVYSERKNNYFGVTYNVKYATWYAQRHSKKENKKLFYNGSYKNEETAAHASDTLARKLMANGEKGHKLNFPDDNTEVYPKEIQNNKRKRPRNQSTILKNTDNPLANSSEDNGKEF